MTRPIHLPPFMSDMNKAENLSCCCDIKTIGQKHVEVLFISLFISLCQITLHLYQSIHND